MTGCAGGSGAVGTGRVLTLHMRATGMLLNVLSMLAFTPGGGSNTKMRPARSRFTGTWGGRGARQPAPRTPSGRGAGRISPRCPPTLGLISMVRKSRKQACGCRECSFFSSCISHPGARCTFFSITHLQAERVRASARLGLLSQLWAAEAPERTEEAYLPDFTAVFIALSAWLKPSAEPGAESFASARQARGQCPP